MTRRYVLQHLVRRRKVAHGDALRAEIILRAAGSSSLSLIALAFLALPISIIPPNHR